MTLALTRKRGERIVFTDPDGNQLAVITVMDIHRSKVKLAINASPSVRVSRAELRALPSPRKEREP